MLVQIIDTYSTIVNGAIPTQIAAEFLSMFTKEQQNSIMAGAGTIVSIGLYFLFFTQYLSDKIGRKKTLAITVFGMAIASFGMLVSINYIMYVLFLFFLNFFFSSDIWLIYVNEEAKPNKRALLSNIILMAGLIGAVMMVMFRFFFITETNPFWRGMFFFPLVLGLIVGILILTTLKESSKYLEIKDKPDIKSRKFTQDIGSVFKIETKKPFKFMLIVSFLFGASGIYLTLFAKFLGDLTSPTFTEDRISIIMLATVFMVIIAYAVNGLLADRVGRKPLLYLWALLLPTTVITWVIGAEILDSFIIVLLGYSLTHVAFWGLWGIIRLITLELLPTDRRGTGMGVRSLAHALGGTTSSLINIFVLLVLPLGLTFIIFACLTLIMIPIVVITVKETKGVELSLIK